VELAVRPVGRAAAWGTAVMLLYAGLFGAMDRMTAGQRSSSTESTAVLLAVVVGAGVLALSRGWRRVDTAQDEGPGAATL
jgi:hypothetical protein